MNTRTMNVALRIATDLDDAVQEVAALDQQLDGLKGAGQNAAQGLSSAATASSKNSNANQGNATSAKAAAASQTALGAATQKTAAIQQRGAISAAQHSMAMRQLPMQITDIVTGLASGQTPFMVAIQQGGQLKDSFGGIVPAGQALAGTISIAATAAVAGAGAIALMGTAAYQAAAELDSLDSAVTMLGGRSGGMALTVGMLQDMGFELDKLEGVTMSSAIETLEQVAATGKFTAEQIELIGTAAERMRASAAGSVEQTIAEFQKLRKDPVAALLELNSTQNFLTQEQLKNIDTLIEQGRQQDAVSEAFRLYAGLIEERTPRIGENVTWLAARWRDLKQALAETYDGAKDLFRDMPDAQRALELQQKINYLRSTIGTGHEPLADTDGQIKRLQGELDALNGARNQAASAPANTVDSEAELARREAEKKREEERKAFFGAEVRYLNDSAKKKREIDAVNEQVTRKIISQEEATRRIALIEADYAAKGKSRGEQKKTDAQQAEESAQRELHNLQKEAAMLDAIEDGQKRASKEAAIRYEIENGSYRAVSAAAKTALIDAARLVDQRQAERVAEEEKRRELEKTERAYEQLQDRLRTPTEAAVDGVAQQVELLNDALAKGINIAGGYEAALHRIGDAAVKPLPSFSRELYQYGIGDPETDRTAEMLAELQKQYQARREIINAEMEKENADRAYWHKKSEDLEAQHQQALNSLAMAESQMRLMQASSAFNSMAEMARAFSGEQSRTYRVLFAISKGFAVAQAAVALAQNVAEASKAGFPQNIGLIAAAMAQGAQIAALLSGANYSPAGYTNGGRITGPGTGTSDDVPLWGSAGEFMVRYAAASQPGAYAFLEDFNQRGMAAVDDWRSYAEGGVITAGSEPRGQFGDGAATRAPAVNNSMHLYNYFDLDSLAQALANHPTIEKAVVNYAGQNGQSIRAEWN